MRLLAGREARRCVCYIVQSSNTWGLKQLVFCYKLLIWDWICEMSFSLSRRKTITGLCKAEWSRNNFRLADQGPQHGVRWDVWAEEQMEGSTHSFQGWLLATESWTGRWTVSIVRLVTLGTSERSRGHAWIPNLYEIGKAFRNLKSRIKQPLLCLDRLNAFPSISFKYFFYTSNQYKSSHSFISLVSFLLSLEKVVGLYRALLYKAAVHEGHITGLLVLISRGHPALFSSGY